MTVRRRRIVAAVVALALTGCAERAGSGDGDLLGWTGSMEERDGVIYAHNPDRGLWQDRDPAPARFELEQTFGADSEPAGAILGDIDEHGVAVDAEGNVYVLDSSSDQIVAFAADGSLRWRAGRSGQGPGELDDPQGIAWDGDASLWVANGSGRRLDVWSAAGEFLASHAPGDRGLPTGRLLGFLDPTTAVVEEGSWEAMVGGVVGIIDVGTWQTLAQLDIDVTTTYDSPQHWVIAMTVSDGVISVGDVDSYELHIFDRTGALVRVIGRDSERMVGSVVSRDSLLPAIYSFLQPAVRLERGHWLTTSAWVEVDDPHADLERRLADGTYGERPWRSSIDLFDPEGRFLYQQESDGLFPSIGQIQCVGRDGKLYTTLLDPYPQVRRYRVVIDGA